MKGVYERERKFLLSRKMKDQQLRNFSLTLIQEYETKKKRR